MTLKPLIFQHLDEKGTANFDEIVNDLNKKTGVEPKKMLGFRVISPLWLGFKSVLEPIKTGVHTQIGPADILFR